MATLNKALNKKAISTTIIIIITLQMILPTAHAFIDDPRDFNEGETYYSYEDRTTLDFIDYWTAVDSKTGEEYGESAVFYHNVYGWRNYITLYTISDWADALGGNEEFVQLQYLTDTLESESGDTMIRAYIRDIVRACGGYIPYYDASKKEYTISTTKPPIPKIFPTEWDVVAGQETTIKIIPKSNVFHSDYHGVQYKFYVDGELVESGGSSENAPEIEIPYTFNEAGEHTLTLWVKDGVWREAEDSITINVGYAGPPELHADLSISGDQSATWEPDDFADDNKETIEIDLDATGTTTNRGIEKYEFYYIVDGEEIFVEENTTGRVNGIEVDIKPSMINVYNQIPVTGKVIVTDIEGNTDQITATHMVDIEISDTPPNADFNHTDPGYATLPFDITNTTRDREDDERYIGWRIRNNNGDLILYSDNDLEDGTTDIDYTPSYFESAELNKDGGTVVFKQEGNYTIELIVRDGHEDVWEPVEPVAYPSYNEDVYSKTVYVNSEPQPPVANFEMLEYGFPNENITVTDTSTDPNNDIVTRNWTKPHEASGYLSGSGGSITFSEEGTYDISLEVIDYTGLTDSITKQIQIIPPLPVAVITAEGTLKENREVIIHSHDSLSPRVDPIQTERNEWNIIPLDGQDPDSIKIDPDTSTDEEKHVVFKEPGRYKVFLKCHNNYSDANPSHPQIDAIDTEKIIEIAVDEDPIPDFTINSPTPNFQDNPAKATVNLTDTSVSPDGDILDQYNWTIKRDNDEDGNFDDEDIYTTFTGSTDLNFDVMFESGNAGSFQVELFLKEEFGQPTIEKYVSEDDRRSAVITKTFDVNWIPDISFNLSDWAYTDDVLNILTDIQDEKVYLTTVEWSLKRANERNPNIMDSVELGDFTINTLGKNGGTIRFIQSGYYELTATVTDNIGQTYSFSREIRIYPLPTAVISDTADYRWNDLEFNAKENRMYAFDGNNSYAADYYGPELHPIDHSRDYWEIIALDGQNVNDAVKIINGVGEAIQNENTSSTTFVASGNHLDELMIFKKPGRYKIRYQVTNTFSKKSPFAEQIITVAEDTEPVIDFKVIETAYRDVNDGKRATLTTYSITAESDDEDVIDVKRIRYRFDSDNDGQFTDEVWSSPLTIQADNTAKVKVDHVGKYQFELYAKEDFGQPTIPEFINDTDYKRSYKYKVIEVDNTNPTVNFELSPENKVDIVFTVGEVESSKIEELNAKIDTYIRTPLEANQTDYISTEIEMIETSTISTNDADAESIFNEWDNYPDNSGQWSYDPNNQSIGSTKNVWFTGFWNSKAQDTTDLIIKCKMGVFPDNDGDNIGITFRQTLTNGKMSFYAFVWNGGNVPGHDSGDQKNGLYKVVNQEPKSQWNPPGIYSPANKLQGFPDSKNWRGNRWYNVEIQVKGNHIQIWIDGEKVIDYVDENEPLMRGGYGVWSHSQAYARFTDLEITTGSIKTLDEVLKEPNWRENSHRFVVNISDKELKGLNDPEKYPVILSRMLNDNLYFAELGTDTNKSQTESFIADNDNKGIFIYNDNPDMDRALQNLGNYILNTVRSLAKTDVRYVLLNEIVHYQTFYEDYENDAKMDSEDRWKYEHDETYFENSLGRVDYHNQWLPNSINQFNKVGLFTTTYQTKDNPVGSDNRFDEYRKLSTMMSGPLEIYVHRKPHAVFSFDLQPNGSTTTETYEQNNIDFSGEDGDYAYWNPSFEVPNGGTVKTIEFLTPYANDDYWSYYLQVEGYKDGSWEIIKDYESEYEYSSDRISDTINVSGEGYTRVRCNFRMYDRADSAYGNPDGAYLKVTYTTDAVTSYNVNFNNYSYDLDHESEPDKGIVEEEWKWKKATDTTWTNGQPTTLELNQIYNIYLRVKDEEGEWSDASVQVIDTSSTNRAPIAQFKVTPNPLVINRTLGYEDYSYDPNGDPITSYNWRVNLDGSWTDYGNSFPSDIYNQLGEYRIEMKVSDGSLWSEPVYQTLTVIPDNQKPIADFDFLHNPIPQDVEQAYTDNSYDPDGDPIVAREWQYRQLPSGSWQNGKPTDFSGFDTGSYEIRLRVKDQPTLPQLLPKWSDWRTKTLSVIAGNRPPIAQFTVTPNPGISDEPVTYINNSYDPDGAGITESVWQVRDENNNILGEYHNKLPPEIFETTGWGDNGAGTYIIALKVKDASPNGLSPALWSDWCERTLIVEDPLYVEGESNKNTYAAGEAMILSADTEGKAFKVEAEMWWDASDTPFASTNTTDLEPELPVSGTPPDTNHWETRHDILGGDYDKVVIIPYDMPEGTYTITFRAYKERYDGTIKTVTDTKTVTVDGSQLNKLKTRLR